DEDDILKGFEKNFTTWEAHNDEVLVLPKTFKVLAHSEKCKVQAMRHIKLPIFGIQFHPEVDETENGIRIFKNFIQTCRE
ncbi:MAG: gamma-glutamyl-gamma-aminobutyrate hydrolase family protein, partial [Candidatus Aenigmarchaeota archaeon]|nr:gamma-glutamyl-gamma-aminobutyrate hydrolase family protein [Candidatus Aenigmarchaeota archaeon]